MDPDVVITLPADASPELIERLAESFPEAGIVIPQPEPVADVLTYDAAIAEVATAAPGLPAAIVAWWGAMPWSTPTIALLIVGALVTGYAIERLVALVLPDARPGDQAMDFRSRLPKGLWHMVRGFVLIGVFAFGATMAYRVVSPGDAALSDFARHILMAVTQYRGFMVLWSSLAAPEAPWRRLMGFTDEHAATAQRVATITMALFIFVFAIRAVVDSAVGADPSAAVVRLMTAVLQGLLGIYFFTALAEPVRNVAMRRFVGVEETLGWSSAPARYWHWFYVGFAILDMVMKAVGILGLLGPEAALGTGAAMRVLILTPLIIAGLSVWNREAAEAAQAEGRNRGTAVGLFALAEGVVILIAGGMLMRAWGIDPLDPPQGDGLAAIIPGVVEAAVVLVAAFAIWRALNALMKPPATAEELDMTNEEHQSQLRLATILPVLRGFALAVLFVVTLMVALSSLGVDIAPLLASAGVLGLAIGFGAQRLVADVISGVLFLYEDAFRVGEYIEVSGGKGAVERISLRSVRLRHPRGPVFTIPFSDMGTVENHSRDYATMKFSFAVPSTVDVEKVRKLIKKAGAAMMEDPEVSDFILEPLKSQGTLSIQGPSYIIGCKFTAKPGKQFIVRRKAYVAIQKTLAANGIELFEPQLTINPAEPGSPPVPMDASGQPAAAAGQPAMVLDRG